MTVLSDHDRGGGDRGGGDRGGGDRDGVGRGGVGRFDLIDGFDRIDLVAEQSPLGGLEQWLADPAVTEVMVNAGTEVWVEREGRTHHVGRVRVATLLAAIEHILTPIGRRLDRTQPTVDARLPDGSRVCAVLPPVAVDGPCLSIRRFATTPLPLSAFAPHDVVQLLEEVVTHRSNVLVCGATSSGKTTLLNALTALVPRDARLVTLEDVAELRLQHPHVVRLETRDATPDGAGEVTLAHLVRTALRLRPDRLVVGEVRGHEAVHLLHALHTGHDGSMATVHANGPREALERLAALVVQAVGNWPAAAVHQHVAAAIDVVVHVARRADGTRGIHEIVEVLPSATSVPAGASGVSGVSGASDVSGSGASRVYGSGAFGALPFNVRTLSTGHCVVGRLARGRS